MTKREAIIISAYTGYLLCSFDEVHAYVEEKLGRHVLTHELVSLHVSNEIAEKVRPDLMSILPLEGDAT
jgi:hypothetical protein